MKNQQWYPVWKDLMQGLMSPAFEERPYTKAEALVDLIEMASCWPNWTISISHRALARRWRWSGHAKVQRFLNLCEKAGKIRRTNSDPGASRSLGQVTVVLPKGYSGRRARSRSQAVGEPSQPHYNREIDIYKKRILRKRTSRKPDPDSPNTLGSHGGVDGQVKPWDLPNT